MDELGHACLSCLDVEAGLFMYVIKTNMGVHQNIKINIAILYKVNQSSNLSHVNIIDLKESLRYNAINILTVVHSNVVLLDCWSDCCIYSMLCSKHGFGQSIN